jgi:hypothetical protein
MQKENWFRQTRSQFSRTTQFVKLLGDRNPAIKCIRPPHLEEPRVKVDERPFRSLAGFQRIPMGDKFGHRSAVAHDCDRFARNQIRIELVRIGVDVFQCERFHNSRIMAEYRTDRNPPLRKGVLLSWGLVNSMEIMRRGRA